MNERDFQNNVVELAMILGWRVAHFRPARTEHGWRTPMIGHPGYPDLTLARKGRVIFAELKKEGAKPSTEQLAWIAELTPGGGTEEPATHEVYIWWPHQLETIKEVLSRA